MHLQWLVLLAAILFASVDSAKILGIFWTFGRSHYLTGNALLKALAASGHEVDVLSTFDEKVNIPNYKHELLTGIKSPGISNVSFSIFSMNSAFVNVLNENAETFWENKAIKQLIKTKPKYDVVIIATMVNDYVLALANYLDAPSIIYSPRGSNAMNNKYVGNPNLPYTDSMATESMTSFFGRLSSTYTKVMMSVFEQYILAPTQNKYIQKYLPGAPTVQELMKNVSLVLMNSHFAIEPPRPYVPNMIQIGGFHSQTTKKLPEDLQNYLDSAKDGAVLFSMGSVIKVKDNFRNGQLDIIMAGLGKIAPIKVLFKSEVEILTAPKNVLVSNWLPQNDILAHPNLKLFISHGGLGGTTEAVFHGVPVLGIPFFVDQKTNIASVIKAGFAIGLQNDKMTQESFDSAIRELLTNSTYAANAKKRSSLLKSQPVKPLENAIWWIEHIIEHKGGEHLRNIGMDLEWYQLYMVDIMLFFLVLICTILVISFFVTRWTLRKLIGLIARKTKKIKEQ
ncbi:hypothetical protein HHI36_003573 [Cryptolaemus montrouzieri]|uniref:UDP-glucuronosyltransferase n=1 Tax=Cryptolaemus montrouzieri TaxID=559131 RepID=A0ABD2PEC3_9CUCU